MSETIEPITISGEGITVSLLLWRRFGQPIAGLVERVYDVNPGLGALGPILPVGTIVRVPVPAPRKSADVTPVRLWG